jgi:TRAP-type C4-dicarboxylate transport system permease small subunit
VVALFGPGVRVAARAVASALFIVFFALLGWMGYAILDVLMTDHLISLPEISVAWVQSVIPISAVLIIVAELLSLPLAFRLARKGHATQAGEATQ